MLEPRSKKLRDFPINPSGLKIPRGHAEVNVRLKEMTRNKMQYSRAECIAMATPMRGPGSKIYQGFPQAHAGGLTLPQGRHSILAALKK